MLIVKVLTLNAFQQNTSVVYCDDTLEAAVIDPGCSNESERNELASFIKKQNLKVTKLLNTHGHIDHVLGNYFVEQTYQVGLGINEIDVPTMRAVSTYAPNYGYVDYQGVEPAYFLNEGDVVNIGNGQLSVLFVPGHTPGHIAFYAAEEKFLIGGDTLFNNSIGRTDLPGGDFELLTTSIKTKLFNLPSDVIVYPGHGQKTTIGFEMAHNPWLQ